MSVFFYTISLYLCARNNTIFILVQMKRIMNRTLFYAFFVAAFALLQVGCAKKKETTNIITHKEKKQKPKPTQKVGDFSQTRTISWLGSNLKITTERLADKSLSIVQDENGNKYYDNKIILKIQRSDGSMFLERVFYKSDFSKFIDASADKTTALLGVVFDKVDGDHLIFAASVGSPDKISDEFIPLVLKVSKSGSLSMYRDSQMDTNDGSVSTGTNTTEDEEDGV